MEIIIVIAVISYIVSYVSKKNRQKQEEAKKAAQASALERPPAASPPPPRGADPRFPDDFWEVFPQASKPKPDDRFPEYEYTPPAPQPVFYDERFPPLVQDEDVKQTKQAGTRARDWENAKTFEPTPPPQPAFAEPPMRTLKPVHFATPDISALVSSFERSQQRKEESAAAAYGETTLPAMLGNRDALVAGILFSELYGRPKALRKGR